MSVNRTAPREVIRCECCSVLDRHWVHVEVRQDGGVRLDVKLCRRCASSVGSALLDTLTYRNTDPPNTSRMPVYGGDWRKETQ